MRDEQEKMKNRTYKSSSSRWSDSPAHTRCVTLSDWANPFLWGCSFISNLSAVWVWAAVGYPQLHIPAPCAVPSVCNPTVNHDTDLMVLLLHGTQSWRNSNKSSNWFQIMWNSHTKEGIHVPVYQWTFSQGFNKNRSRPSNSLHQTQIWQATADIGSFNSELSSKKWGWERKKWPHQTYLRDPESFGCCRSLSAWFNAIRLSPKARAT